MSDSSLKAPRRIEGAARPGDGGLTEQIAAFLSETTLEQVPSGVRHAAKRSILDGVGLAVAGRRSDAAELTDAELRSYGFRDGGALVLGSEDEYPARFAAFAMGLAIHAHDFDDTQLAVAPDRVYGLLTHPTATVLATVLALAQRERATGAQALRAFLLGTEAEMKISEAIAPRHYADGFHSTATAGTLGAAAGAAVLLDLDPAQTAVALAIAGSQAAGLRENFGTMTKPFHAGRAAESGVLAADLAARGFTAAPNILEGSRGFFRAAGGGYDPAAIDGRLGQPWTFDSPGVSIKPHPSGVLTHPGMAAMLALIDEHDLRAEDVRSVTVGAGRHMPNALIHHRPTNELQAKFSMEFCVAVLLIERRAGLAEFSDEVVNRPDIQEMIRRVEFGVDPEADGRGYNSIATIVRVETTTGQTLEARRSFPRGSPQDPWSDQQLLEKYLDCLRWGGVGADAGRKAASRLLALEDEPDVGDLVAQLAAEPAQA